MTAAPKTTNSRTPLERAADPGLGTELIPKTRYTSAEFAVLERERLWSRTWLLAGFECDFPECSSL